MSVGYIGRPQLVALMCWWRFYFYSNEPNEPPHVHVDRDTASCNVWRVPVALSSSLGYGARELREIERLVSLNRAILLIGEVRVFHRLHPSPDTDKGAVASIRKWFEEHGVTP